MRCLLLDRVGIHAFDHLTTLLLAIDPARTDILVGHYSWLLMRAFGTRDYAEDVRNAQTPLAVVVGEKDELFDAEKFAPTLDAIKPEIPVTIIPGLSHTELTTDPSAVPAIIAAVRGGASESRELTAPANLHRMATTAMLKGRRIDPIVARSWIG